jgi:uncharacterized protein (DUF2141 family)
MLDHLHVPWGLAWAASLLGLAMPVQGEDAPAGSGVVTLVVTCSGIVPNGGTVYVAVWRESTGWPETPGPTTVTTKAEPIHETIEIRIPGQKPGTVALSVYQDTDGNGRLDMGSLGPREPWGTSRNVTPAFRGPRYDESTVDISASMSAVTITMHR